MIDRDAAPQAIRDGLLHIPWYGTFRAAPKRLSAAIAAGDFVTEIEVLATTRTRSRATTKELISSIYDD